MSQREEARKLFEEKPLVLTVADVCKLLGVSRRAIIEAIQQNHYSWAVEWYRNGRYNVRIITEKFKQWYFGGENNETV